MQWSNKWSLLRCKIPSKCCQWEELLHNYNGFFERMDCSWQKFNITSFIYLSLFLSMNMLLHCRKSGMFMLNRLEPLSLSMPANQFFPGIALRKHSPQILQQILKLLETNRLWWWNMPVLDRNCTSDSRTTIAAIVYKWVRWVSTETVKS